MSKRAEGKEFTFVQQPGDPEVKLSKADKWKIRSAAMSSGIDNSKKRNINKGTKSGGGLENRTSRTNRARGPKPVASKEQIERQENSAQLSNMSFDADKIIFSNDQGGEQEQRSNRQTNNMRGRNARSHVSGGEASGPSQAQSEQSYGHGQQPWGSYDTKTEHEEGHAGPPLQLHDTTHRHDAQRQLGVWQYPYLDSSGDIYSPVRHGRESSRDTTGLQFGSYNLGSDVGTGGQQYEAMSLDEIVGGNDVYILQQQLNNGAWQGTASPGYSMDVIPEEDEEGHYSPVDNDGKLVDEYGNPNQIY